jgi:hypothetical protein
MDFYFDEQLPKVVAEALNVLESREGVNRVLSTETEFGKGVKDVELYNKLKDAHGVLVTHDLKMITRKAEFALIKHLGVSVFVLSLPSGANFEFQYQTIIAKWAKIKELYRKNNSSPFVCRIKMRGDPEFL